MIATWNGLPDQPDRSGWHWVKAHWNPSPRPYYWLSKDQVWHTEYGCQPPEEIISRKYSYFCPCPDPSELAQMRKDERGRCAKACDEVFAKSNQIYMKTDNEISENYWCGVNDGSIMCANAIRALTDDEGKKS